MSQTQVGGVAVEQLRSIVQRVEKLEEEKVYKKEKEKIFYKCKYCKDDFPSERSLTAHVDKSTVCVSKLVKEIYKAQIIEEQLLAFIKQQKVWKQRQKQLFLITLFVD